MVTATKELIQIYEQHNLEYPKHWATRRLIREILNNDNQNIAINEKPNQFLDNTEPIPLESAIPQFIELFEQGYEIIYTCTQYHGDEGGSLYLAYLLKPGFRDQYYSDFDQVLMANENPLFFQPMKYIMEHPEQFTEIWAGAY